MGYAHTAIVIGISVAINGFLTAWWATFKQRQALRPQQMALKNGVYVPWGIVQKIERFGRITTIMWCVYIALLLAALLYVKLS